MRRDSLDLTIRGSLLEDVGEYITLSTPMLGHIIPGNREVPRPDPDPSTG
jgi:hypothetical protein